MEREAGAVAVGSVAVTAAVMPLGSPIAENSSYRHQEYQGREEGENQMVEMENIQWQQQRQLMESNSSPTVLKRQGQSPQPRKPKPPEKPQLKPSENQITTRDHKRSYFHRQ